MSPAEVAARVSLPIAAGISVLLARRVPSYRPVAETLLIASLLDLARGNVSGTIFDPPLLLAFPCLSASLALCVLGKLPRWPVALAWGLLAALTLVPTSREFLEPLGRVYGAVHVGGLLLQIVGVWIWTWEGASTVGYPKSSLNGGLVPPRRAHKLTVEIDRHVLRDALRTVSDRSDTVAPFAVLMLFAGDLAALFGPFASGNPQRDWYVGQAQTVLLFLVFNVWQVVQIRRAGGKLGPRTL